jgi:hypothetical protein
MRWTVVLLATLTLPLARASAVERPNALKTLRAATLEPAPNGSGSDRFRLRARLQPAPAPAADARAGRLKLGAALAPKASTAACPLPGAIFADGYESP